MSIEKGQLSEPAIQPVVISAPFGNYIQPAGTTPTLGTFTLARRPGRVWRILKTLRYDFKRHGWVNRIGLRNPGIDWLVQRVQSRRVDLRDKLVSIHGFDDAQWQALLEHIASLREPGGPLAVELNMSCPNVGELDCPERLFEWAVQAMGGDGGAVVVKLPPVNYELIAERALEQGVRAFHCCNTIPVERGGLSGPAVKPLSIACIRWLRSQVSGGTLRIIGGGGVREPADVDEYAQAGANHIALGTRVMRPWYLLTDAGVRSLIEHAQQRLNG